ncbi:uncharacterized protein LOC124151989 [Haliotis rufescens]|uniref:uncharacterized protein LOC124151989 n=1 Tax=Haliotis rufescens TaxID=6454 RepID=UPI00201E9AB4|nr:uncharacterized protein LOC124151989 [Haliotis rufescens]
MATCPRDFYMDGKSGKCQSCAELCHQAEVRGTVELCTNLCPVSSDNSVPEAYIDTATTTSATEAAVIAPIDDENLIPEGVVITLAVVIILVSLAALVILLFCERIEKHASHRRGLDEDVEPSVTLNSVPVNLH